MLLAELSADQSNGDMPGRQIGDRPRDAGHLPGIRHLELGGCGSDESEK